MSGPMTTADDDEWRNEPEVLRYTLVKPKPIAPCQPERKPATRVDEKEKVP